ncbi:hypothetical protein [Novosphingobium sp.]|uniref:hypothetical protein n=1 Tax=Novosphingobium sp. TaxID=1874826 RepID=UPI0025CF455F|nr:hypothetical protein [Novosphingobium sp.]
MGDQITAKWPGDFARAAGRTGSLLKAPSKATAQWQALHHLVSAFSAPGKTQAAARHIRAQVYLLNNINYDV